MFEYISLYRRLDVHNSNDGAAKRLDNGKIRSGAQHFGNPDRNCVYFLISDMILGRDESIHSYSEWRGHTVLDKAVGYGVN